MCFIGKLRYLPGYQCSDTENDLGMLSSPPAHKIQHTLNIPGKRLSKNRPNDSTWITISILSKFQQWRLLWTSLPMKKWLLALFCLRMILFFFNVITDFFIIQRMYSYNHFKNISHALFAYLRCFKMLCVPCMLSCIWLFVGPWTISCQTPLSAIFFKQEY